MSRALLLLLAGCGPKEIPPHLRPDPPAASAEARPTGPPADLDEATRQLVGTDPLVRRPVLGPPEHTASLAGGDALRAWAAQMRAGAVASPAWYELEARWPGTVAVPLSRGARLAALEIDIAQSGADPEAALPWVAPVVSDGAPLPAAARGPLSWLGVTPAEESAAALHIAERAVLLGWLDGPDLPTSAPAAAFREGVHDRLTGSRAGALLVARAADARAPDRGAAGRDALATATRLALLGAAADRDKEQAAHAAAVDAVRQGEDDLDPVGRLLARAAEDLTADAGSTESTGAALVALTAERLRGSCPDTPCVGLDRVQTLEAAERWGATRQATLWRVIALKGVLDRLDVARDRPSFPQAVVDLSDALVGTGAGSVPERLLRARRPDAAVWLAVSRAADGGDGTAWEDARRALAARLVAACEAALATGPEPELADALRRIARRAEGA